MNRDEWSYQLRHIDDNLFVASNDDEKSFRGKQQRLLSRGEFRLFERLHSTKRLENVGQ